MRHTGEQMMHGISSHMYLMWGGFGLVAFLLLVALMYFSRPARTSSLLVSDLPAARGTGLLPTAANSPAATDGTPAPLHDTIFILPDISNYTRFMTGNRFAFDHAQHIVFSLINAMVEAAANTVELSKLEGDAALFFVDADRHDGAVIGQTLHDIFSAFFCERGRLIEANTCPCSACTSIKVLDLKIFVHRGEASRFSFRGSIDHFGTDVIILHRIMKNGVGEKRYVMITEAAADSIDLPFACKSYPIEEELENVGSVSATVHSLDNETVSKMIEAADARKLSKLSELARKMAGNAHSALSAIGKRQ